MKWIDAARVRLRLLFARRAADERMDEEFRFHVDMETERLVREEHLGPAEARRRALVAFGGVDRYGEALRDGRGLGWLNGLSLDLRLGLRMLVKYPGLTIVGGLGMAVAIAVAGVAIGLVLAAALDVQLETGYAALLAPVAAAMLAVGMLAAIGPARRGLRIHPTEALRED